jgi:large subunit ribosomal protein L15
VKLHDLQPAPGSTKRRIRVGRGIAAWFEGGQTPIHVRVPKLRGFKRRDRVEYQVVNVGRISEYAAAGRFGGEPGGKEPLTVNAEVLAAAGLIRHADRPLKVLGLGDAEVKLFVAADAFTASARSKIEQAGGFVQLLAPVAAATGTEVLADAPTEVPADAGQEVDAPAEATAAALEQSTDETPDVDADSGKATE